MIASNWGILKPAVVKSKWFTRGQLKLQTTGIMCNIINIVKDISYNISIKYAFPGIVIQAAAPTETVLPPMKVERFKI